MEELTPGFHAVTAMDTTDHEQITGLSNPVLTEEAIKIIRKSIKDNVKDGGKAWQFYTDTELEELGLGYLNKQRTK